MGANIASLRIQTQLTRATAATSTSFERLSSGLRINKASDDPAGLALASALGVHSKVHAQAFRNISDGVSYLSIAESSAQSLKSILERMTELATQSANEVYTSAQRTALDTEAQALQTEYNRILQTTKFNGRAILTSSELINGIVIQAGFGSQEALSASFSSLNSTLTPDGTFQSAVAFAGGEEGLSSVTAADFNGDGKLDLVTGSGTMSTGSYVNVLIGNGDGTFDAKTSYAGGWRPYHVIAVDNDGDGKLDLISTAFNDNFINIMAGNGDGTFKAPTSFETGYGPTYLSSTDFNGDGKADLAVALLNDAITQVFLSNGNGTYQAPYNNPFGGLPSLSTGDLNGDGNQDLIYASNINTMVLVALGAGDGTFAYPISYDAGGLGVPYFVTSADVTGDGKIDILTLGADNAFSVLVGNGDGTFNARLAANSIGAASGATALITTDLNDDGKLDAIVTTYSNNRVNVFLGNGDGTFKARYTYAGGSGPSGLAIADFNNDGTNDIITAGTTDDRLSFLAGNSTASAATLTGMLSSISGISITTQSGAEAAITTLSAYSTEVDSFMGAVGAFTSRFNFASNVASIRAENYAAAELRITSLDVAEEVANLVKKQVLQSAAAALLAQANQQPQIVLELLRP